MIDAEKFKEIIDENRSFLLTTHVNPDADAIGSETGMYHALKKLGKEVHIINHSETPFNLEFLDEDNIIQYYDPHDHDELINSVDVHMFLDLNQMDRVKSLEDTLRKGKALKVCVDHHQDPENFADFYFTDTEVSSTGEIVFDLLKSIDVQIDRKIALPLYAAIMTDTGSFRYERTNKKTHAVAGELLETGINPEITYDLIYEQSNLARMLLLGKALSSIELSADGKISYMVIRLEDLSEAGAVESDVEGFVNYSLSVRGAVIGLLFYELKDGLKISFRSKGKIPINKLASEFGGGGHINAAGTRLYEGTIDEYIKKVTEAAVKYLPKQTEEE